MTTSFYARNAEVIGIIVGYAVNAGKVLRVRHKYSPFPFSKGESIFTGNYLTRKT
jgi:hypothetical protein